MAAIVQEKVWILVKSWGKQPNYQEQEKVVWMSRCWICTVKTDPMPLLGNITNSRPTRSEIQDEYLCNTVTDKCTNRCKEIITKALKCGDVKAGNRKWCHTDEEDWNCVLGGTYTVMLSYCLLLSEARYSRSSSASPTTLLCKDSVSAAQPQILYRSVISCHVTTLKNLATV